MFIRRGDYLVMLAREKRICVSLSKRILALAGGERQKEHASSADSLLVGVGIFLQQFRSRRAPDFWTFADAFAKLSRNVLT